MEDKETEAIESRILAEFQKAMEEATNWVNEASRILKHLRLDQVTLAQFLNPTADQYEEPMAHELFLWSDYRILQQQLVTFKLNRRLAWAVKNGQDKDDYEYKKYLVKLLGNDLRRLDMTILHPVSNRPSNLYAVSSADKRGRYVIEDRETSKRSNSKKSLLELLPLKMGYTERTLDPSDPNFKYPDQYAGYSIHAFQKKIKESEE